MGFPSRAWLAPLVLAWAGCGGDGFVADPTADATMDAYPDAADATVDSEEVVDAGSDAPDTGAPDVAMDVDVPDVPMDAGPACSTIKSSEAVVVADGVIIEGNCSGANSFLVLPFANVGIGRGLVRFIVDGPTEAAFTQGRVVSMRLALTRKENCDGSTCPSSPGFIEAYPLRNDWDEGTNQAYSGADWCRRLGGNPGELWNAPGANQDHGDLAAEVPVSEGQLDLSIPLEPSAFAANWVAGGKLSMLLIPNNATFVFATKEASAGKPRLVVEYCD